MPPAPSQAQPQQERQGGCLCGLIRYTLSSSALYNTLCHCANCRRITGSAALTASICPKAGLAVTQKREGVLKSYTDAATQSGRPLTRTFCGECGSTLFAFTPLREDIVSVAAGSLDGFEDWAPDTEQFCIHRAGFLEKAEGVQPERRFTTNVRLAPESE